MKHSGCKLIHVLRERKPHVEISVAFLLITITTPSSLPLFSFLFQYANTIFSVYQSGTRPPQAGAQAPGPRPNQQQHGPQAPQGPPGPPQFPQHSPYPQHFYPPPPGQWGRGGPVPGYPGMPYGVPPGWYPPHGQGYPQGGPFPYGGFPPGPPGQQFPQQPKPAPIGVGAKQQVPGELSADKPVEPKALVKPPMQAPVTGQTSTPTPPPAPKSASNESKVTTNSSQPSAPTAALTTASKAIPTGPKNGRVVPAVPLQNPAPAKTMLEAKPSDTGKAPTTQMNTASNRAALDDATQAATAAVAAAMAKLPPIGGQQTNGNNAVDNLTKKVKEMRASDPTRGPRGSGGHRGRGRGGLSHDTAKFEVPATDFDFESSNAKFNKSDLVKEAIAGSPLAETPPSGHDDSTNGSVVISAASYNKSASFFDDLSSDNKDRTDGGDRQGGRAWRGEEQKKNLETFGQGSVDNGYRGGYRGRGRGRGGHRGRGYAGNGQPGMRGGRGGYRGGRGDSQAATQ